MAPVVLKRKKFFLSLPETLGKIHDQIEALGGNPVELLPVLQQAINTPWPYEKGDLSQWCRVLDILDAELGKEESPPDLCVAILRFTRLLLENCSNRHVYNSYEHLKRLLEVESCDVVMAVLRVLSVLATPRSTRQLVCEASFIVKLSSLSAVWSGSPDRVLSLVACCREEIEESVLEAGTRVNMQIYRTGDDAAEAGSVSKEGLEVIRIERAHELEGTDSEVVQRLLTEHDVPKEFNFALCTRLRLARAFPDYTRRLQWVRVQIMAATVLAQCQAVYGAGVTAVAVNETQLSELIELLHPQQDGVMPLDIQTLALKALTALLTERSKQTSMLVAATAASHHGILAAMIRKTKSLVADTTAPDLADRLRFGEALLAFTWMFASSASGSTALNNAGILHLIVPFLEDASTRRGRFLTLAVKTLEVVMNYSQEMQQTFREIEGVATLVKRAYAEVQALVSKASAPTDGDGNMEVDGEPQPSKASAAVIAGGSGAASGSLSPEQQDKEEEYERCRLLGAILNLLSSAATPLATASDVRDLMSGMELPALLTAIFKDSKSFGAAVYEKAASLLTEFVHQEPACLQHVLSSGVAEAFLGSVSSTYPVSRGVVSVVPSVLGALCLSAAGCQMVEQAQPIAKFMSALCSDKVTALLQGECPSNLGVQLEELMRHNPSLLDSCMAGCVHMATRIPSYMEEVQQRQEGMPSSSKEAPGQPLSAQSYLTCAVEFLSKLLEPLMSAAEHARSFVRKDGVQALLHILALPQLPRSFSRSEAGRFIILVLGKSAFHSPSKVLGEVMQRTRRLVSESMGSVEGVKEDAAKDEQGTGQPLSKEDREGKLVALELHVSVLCGIVGCFRGSSTATEWDNEQGAELVAALAQCYIALSSMPAAGKEVGEGSPMQMTDSTTATGSQPASGDQAGSAENGASDAGAAGANGAASAAAPNQPGTDGTDEGNTGASATAANTDDVRQQAANTICSLLSRLSSSVGVPGRRRQEEGNSSNQANVKAMAKVLAGSLLELVSWDKRDVKQLNQTASGVTGSVDVLTACLFGEDGSRSTARGVNMVVLQAWDEAGGIARLAAAIAFLIQNSGLIPNEGGESSVSEEMTKLAAKQIAHFLALGKRLMTTSLAVLDRAGQPLASSGFDEKLFTSKLKYELFEAMSALWTKASPRVWPSVLVPRVFELLGIMLKPDSPPDAAASESAAPAPAQRARPPMQYDPRTVQALMEMGFDERRVHQALDHIRSNSVELATEWLFMNSEGAGEDEEESEIARAMALSLEGQPAAGAGAATPSTDKAPDGEAASAQPEEVSPAQQLQQKRMAHVETIKGNVLQWSLDVLEASGSADLAVVDVLAVVSKENADERTKVVCGLLDSVFKKDGDLQPAGASALLHALAFLVTESTECCASAQEAGCIGKLADLLGGVEITAPDEGGSAKAPAMMCPGLLVVGSLLMHDDQSRVLTQFPNPGKGESLGEEKEGTVHMGDVGAPEPTSTNSEKAEDYRAALMRVCLDLLDVNPDAHLLQATLQVVARLTKNHVLAMSFLQQGGLKKLLLSPQSTSFAGQASLTGTVVRHLMEDANSLLVSMQSEIRLLLTSLTARSNGRLPSVRSFLSAAAALVQRDPATFHRAVKSTCKIIEEGGRKTIGPSDRREDRLNQSTASALDASQDKGSGAGDAETPGRPSTGGSTRSRSHSKAMLEGMHAVMGQLLAHLLAGIRDRDKAAGDDAMQVDDKESEEQKKPAISAADILRYLAELVRAYPGCSHYVMKHSVDVPDTVAEASKSEGKKPSTSLISYVIREVLPLDSAAAGGKASKAAARDADLSRRGAALVLAMLSKGPEVRKKLLLELVATLNLGPTKRMSLHLRMLQCIADVLYSFVTAKAHSANSQQPAPETVRVMLEAKIPSAICTALASIDLHHPAASKVSAALLRPLDVLCESAGPPTNEADGRKEVEGQAADKPEGETGGRDSAGDWMETGHGGGVQFRGEGEAEAEAEEAAAEAARAEEMEGSEEDAEGSEEEEEEEEEEGDESDEERGSQGSQEQEDEQGSHMQGEGAGLLEGEYEEDDSMADLIETDDDDVMVAHEAGEHDRQDLGHHFDSILERFIDNHPHSALRLDDALEMSGGQRVELEDGSQHVLSLLVPGGRGMNGARLLQNFFPGFPEMQVIRFPSRDGREPAGIPDGRNAAAALEEAPPTEHPLLARRQDARSRVRPPPGAEGGWGGGAVAARMFAHDADAAGGLVLTNMGVHLPGAPPGARQIARPDFAEMWGSPEYFGQAQRRWQDPREQGGQIRGLPAEMEDRLIEALTDRSGATAVSADPAAAATAPAGAQGGAAGGSREGGAPGEAGDAGPADAKMQEAGEGEEDVSMHEGEGSAGAAGAENDGRSEGVAGSVGDAASAEADAGSVATGVEGGGEGGEEEEGQDPMDEDEDLEAALRLSMQEDAATAEAAGAGPGHASEGAEERQMEVAAGDASGAAPAPAAGEAGQAATAPAGGEEGQAAGEGGAAGPEIDPDFLAEIPEELREEVMAQQMRVQAAAQLASTSTNAIDPDFLAALPPDIQADVIRQHQREEEEARQREQQGEAGEGDVSRSQEMDNASFVATLPQELREEVLLTSDDAFLATLPPHLAAEAALLRERANEMSGSRYHQHLMSRRQAPGAIHRFPGEAAAAAAGPASRVVPGGSSAAAPAAKRQVVQENQVESIVRLLYISRPVNKTIMHKMLTHLSAHVSTREAAVRLLLAAVLQVRMASSEEQMVMQEVYGSHGGAVSAEGSPGALVSRRALEALCHLTVQQVEVCKLLLRKGLLTEEVLRRWREATEAMSTRDGKAAASTAPPFSMLLSLLAHDMFCRSPSLQEQLLQLLNSALLASDRGESAEAQGDEGRGSGAGLPRISGQELQSLTHAIAHPSSSHKAMEKAMNLLKALSWESANLLACIAHLVAETRAQAEQCREGLEKLLGSAGALSVDACVGEHDVKLLRLAKTLKSLWPGSGAGAEAEGARGSVSEALGQEELWELVGKVLGGLEAPAAETDKSGPPPSMSPALARMQPLVEALLIVKAPDPAPKQGAEAANARAEEEGEAGGGEGGVEKAGGRSGEGMEVEKGRGASFMTFVEEHRGTLNMYIRQDKALLHSMAFSSLVAHPKLLDFDNKKHYFRSELKRRNAHERHGAMRVNVRRELVFEDSFHQIVLRKPEELKGRLTVVFNGEEGVDAGGLTREWYLTLSKQMLNPDKALFIHSANGLTYQPNPASTIQPDHLKYFKFAGQVVGKALWDEQLLDAHFTLSMYKHMLNQPIEYKDVEAIDPEYFRNLGWMLDNDITGILEETFSVVREQFGVMLTIDLKPNGRNLPVTEQNKHEYVQLVAEQQLTKGIREQIEAFKEGFHQLMPPDLISIFTCSELELLMCGLPTIDVEDLRANTEYTGYTRDSMQIQWYWQVVESLNQEDLARLLQFVTGTSQVPMDGFKALRGMNGPQKFNIHRLPCSHTCFNQLDLPEYPNQEMLRSRLISAIREGFQGFGFS